jgi:hypothetical protein
MLGAATNICINGACNQSSGFTFDSSLHLDGVNDFASVGVLSSTAFNPFNDTDWTVSWWMKSDGSRYSNQGTVCAVATSTGTGNPFMYIRTRNDGLNDSKLEIRSNVYVGSSTYTITSAKCQVWQHYVVTCTQEASQQTLKIYVNSVLVDTIALTLRTETHSSISFQIGTSQGTGAFNPFKGYVCELGFWERALPEADVLKAYGGGDGVDLASIAGIVNYYRLLSTDGPQSGTMADIMELDDMTLNGFLSPYGVISDTP